MGIMLAVTKQFSHQNSITASSHASYSCICFLSVEFDYSKCPQWIKWKCCGEAAADDNSSQPAQVLIDRRPQLRTPPRTWSIHSDGTAYPATPMLALATPPTANSLEQETLCMAAV